MQNPLSASGAPRADVLADVLNDGDDSSSAVSWAAIWGGTFAATALCLILLALGAGFGLASMSPWSQTGSSAKHFTYLSAIWLIVVQWLSFGVGGYLTGRLRTKWVGVHTHEVFFRDTAHGFLTWSVSTVVAAVFFVLATTALIGVHGAMMHHDGEGGGADSYYTAHLLRSDHPGTPSDQDTRMDPDTKMEVNSLLMKGMTEKNLSDADRNYLAQIVSARTGLDIADADKRVEDTLSEARMKADQARKATATLAIFTFLSMLIGAFISCVAAAIGGQERDMPHPSTI